MRVECPVGADASLQPQLGGIGRQQQLDGGCVEADSVIEAAHAVLGVDTLDDHHRHQHLDRRDLCRVTGEQRLDVVRPRRCHDEIHPIPRHIDPRQGREPPVDLCDNDAVLECGRLDDHRRVLGIRPSVEIAGVVRRVRRNERHIRRQIHKVAPIQLEVGVNGVDPDLAFTDQARQLLALRAREGEVDLLAIPFSNRAVWFESATTDWTMWRSKICCGFTAASASARKSACF